MPRRPHRVLLLLCLVLLSGCAAKNTGLPKPAGRFPDQPVLALAGTPTQRLPGVLGRQAFSISGGWGFRQAEAFVLAAPVGQRQSYANTVPLESLLVRTRNELEFSETPSQGNRYVVVDYGTDSRTIGVRQDRMYAVWRGQARVLSEQMAPALYQKAINLPLAKRASPDILKLSRPVSREYWFDITGTSGRNSFAAAR